MKIRGSEINLEVFKEDIDHFKTLNWAFSKWIATPAIKDKSGGTTKFVGQQFNPEQWEYLEDGWNHDDCEICLMTLFDSENTFENYGYISNEEDWLCFECYQKLIREDFNENHFVLKEKFKLSNGNSILFVSPIIENHVLEITNKSKFGQSELKYYLDKPRKLLRNGELDDQTFAIMLGEKDEINNFEVDKLYELVKE